MKAERNGELVLAQPFGGGDFWANFLQCYGYCWSQMNNDHKRAEIIIRFYGVLFTICKSIFTPRVLLLPSPLLLIGA